MSEEDITAITTTMELLKEALTAMEAVQGESDQLIDYFAVAFVKQARVVKQEATDSIDFATLVTDSKKGSEPAKKTIKKIHAITKLVKSTTKDLGKRLKQAKADKAANEKSAA